MSPLRWTCKSRAKLSAALCKAGWTVSTTTVGRLLHDLGYSPQSIRKSREGLSHPDRNTQFEHINATASDFLDRMQPVISVDTKKKELVGDFKNGGQEWQSQGTPEKTLVHDFPQDATGKAIPGYTHNSRKKCIVKDQQFTAAHKSLYVLFSPLMQALTRGAS